MDAFNLIEHRLQLLSRAGDDLQQKIKIACNIMAFCNLWILLDVFNKPLIEFRMLQADRDKG